MMEKRALADTRLLGHGSGPKARKAARGNDFERRMRDALTHLLRPFALRTPLTFHAAVRNGITTSTNRSRRSEEHTSELQSLMRISYAGFCLKKKNPTH